MAISNFRNKLNRLSKVKKLSKLKDLSRDVDIFFVISAGRSGSTMLRKELMQVSNMYLPPESENLIPNIAEIWLMDLHKDYSAKLKDIVAFLKTRIYFQFWEVNIEELETELYTLKKPNLDEVIFAIYKHQACAMGIDVESTLIGDKTPFLNYYLAYVNAIFPKGKVIYLIRDPRAVVASYLNSNLNYTLEQAIQRWETSIHIYNRQRRKFGSRILEVKYEDLVQNPEVMMEKIIRFLGGNMNVQSNNEIQHLLGDSDVGHYQNIKKPITSESVEKWRTTLSKDQIDQIESRLGKKMKKLGYNFGED